MDDKAAIADAPGLQRQLVGGPDSFRRALARAGRRRRRWAAVWSKQSFARRVPPVLSIAVCALAFRLGSAVLALLTNVAFPDYRREQFTVFGRADPFWDALARHDSGWYFQIARFGYHYTPDGRDTIAFFPAYPLLMRYVGRAFGTAPSDLYVGGVVVSWLGFAAAMIGLYKLARLDMTAHRASRVVILAAVFPFSYFFGAVYSEATFLAACVWAFYAFRTRRWLLGGLCGALATATRVNGILLWPAVAWLVWAAFRHAQTAPSPHGDRSDRVTAVRASARERAVALVGLLLVPCGIAGYSLFVYQLTGHPLEWAATVQRWGYYPGGSPALPLWNVIDVLTTRPYQYLTSEPMAVYDSLNGLAAMVFVVATPLIWYRFGTSYGIFMAANLWLPLSSGQYEGLGRYCSVLFPFFIAVGGIRSRTLLLAVLATCAMLYAFCLSLFVNIHPLF